MTIEVELPDGTVAEFPDGTHPDVMKKALSKYKAAPPEADRPFAAGMGRAVDRVLDGATGLYLKARGETGAEAGLAQNVAEKRKADTTGGLNNSPNASWGEATADAAMSAVPAGKTVDAFQALRRAPGVLRTALGIGGAATAGAGYEAEKAPNPGETREGNAESGAMWGAGGQMAGNVLSRAIRGFVRPSPAAMRLPQEVQDAATLGQLADRTTTAGRFASGTEEKLKSVPLVGDAITNARVRGVDAWRNNVLDQSAAPGTTAPRGATMRDTVEGMQQEFGDQYRTALQGHRIGPSQAFEARVLRNTNDPMAGLTPAQQEEVRNMVMNYYQGMFSATPRPGGGTGLGRVNPGTPVSITPEQAKQFEAFLSSQARGHRLTNQPQSQAFSNMYDRIESAWTPAYRSQLPVATRRQLGPIDEQYAKFKTAERASTSVGNEEGAFTPNQLLTSVKARTAKPEFARGGGLLQEEADAGKTVFQDKIPNSGTSDRTMNATALGAAIMDPIVTGSVLAGTRAGVVPLFTSRGGKNAMMGQTRAQLLLQRLRADNLLNEYGVPIGEMMQGATE